MGMGNPGMKQQLWDGAMMQQLDMNGFPMNGMHNNVQQVFGFPTNGMNGMMGAAMGGMPGMMNGVMIGYGPMPTGAHNRVSPGDVIGVANNPLSPNTIFGGNVPIRMLAPSQQQPHQSC